VALEAVELLELRAAGGGELSGGDPEGVPANTALATLRVTLRQAVYLAAAENFGYEVRLLVRPPGDSERAGGFSVGEAEL
jgi:hypothetical protein